MSRHCELGAIEENFNLEYGMCAEGDCREGEVDLLVVLLITAVGVDVIATLLEMEKNWAQKLRTDDQNNPALATSN
jgi:hypothetical protein